MSTATISINVDEDTARAFAGASDQQRRKWELLLSLQLQDLIESPPRPLKELMDEIGYEAQANGMTPEILESILNDK